LSDYKTLFSELVIPAGIAGIQIPWMDLSLPSMALDARFPAPRVKIVVASNF
jgi:hypothetical protein